MDNRAKVKDWPKKACTGKFALPVLLRSPDYFAAKNSGTASNITSLSAAAANLRPDE